MKLVDPDSKSLFSISKLSKFTFLSVPLSRYLIGKARRAARSQNWSEAVSLFLQALKISPHNGSAWVQLGHNLGLGGKTDSAQIAYYNATLAQPRLAQGHKHLGLVRYKTSLRDEGIASLARALFLNPLDTQLRQLLIEEEGEPQIEMRVGVAALTHADNHANAKYIGVRATMLRIKARKAARDRQWVDAVKLYRRLTRMRPGDAQLFIQLGHALNEQNNHTEAEEAYRRAAAADPLLPDAWLHLGYVLTAQKKHLLAREAFAVVNRLAPARRSAHPILGSADIMQNIGAGLTDQRMICPAELGSRERNIWLKLAANIESKH